jgi:integrase
VTDLGKWAQESLAFRGSKLEARERFTAWRITLAQLADEYLAHLKTLGRSAGWVAHQRQYLNGPMAAAFGKDTPVNKIARRDLQSYLARLATGVRRTTANKHRASLRTLFQFAVDQGYVSSSPAADVRRLKHDGRVHNRYLTLEEFRRLREVADAQRTARPEFPTVHAFDDLPEYLDLAISLATRPTETLTLKFSDVD